MQIFSDDKPFPIWRLYFSAMGMFLILRIAFWIYHYSFFADNQIYDLFRAFLNGLMIDSSVTASTLFLVRLFTMFIQMTGWKVVRRLYLLFVYIMFSIYFFINLADIMYFKMFDSRLNILLLDNLDQMVPIIQTIIKDYPVVIVSVIWIVVVVLFVWVSHRLFGRFINQLCEKFNKTCTIVTMLSLLFLSFLWVGEPFWRTSLFSVSDQALNQLSLNGVYTLIKAVDQKRIMENDSDGITCLFGPMEEAIQFERNLVCSENEELTSELYPMARKIVHPDPLPVLKPNIVIILMEGFSASYIGVLDPDSESCSPGFDKLTRTGIFFTNFYGQGTRTHHGIVSIVGSFPSLMSAMLTRRRGTESFYTLGTIFKQYGYNTSFIYGYDSGFDHMGFFLKQGGIDRIIDQVEFPAPKFRGKWGVSDEDLFDKVHEFFLNQQPDVPFFSVILTSSNHSPFEVPDDFLNEYTKYADDKKRAAFAYSDYALTQYIEKARTAPYFRNTIYVVLADHGEIRDSEDRYLKRFHIPCLIYAPYLLTVPRVIGTIGSQVDIGPILMHLIGYPDAFHLFGRNLLTISEEEGFAVMRNNFNVFYRKGNSVLLRDIRDTISIIYEVDSLSRMLADRVIVDDSLKTCMNKELESYLQTLHHIYSTGKHRYGSSPRE